MSKKLIAVITAIVVLISAVCVGTAVYLKNKKVTVDESYLSIELSPEKILFSQYSNKPNMELVLDGKTFAEAFGEEVTTFAYEKSDRIRIHLSDGEKIEIEPTEETVKVVKDNDTTSIKVYIDDKDFFEKVNDLVKFDTACSVKVFFDAGAFDVDGSDSKAVTFILKSESKPVSDVQQAYMRLAYENYALKLSMTDAKGDEIVFTVSGNTRDEITVFADAANKHIFSSNIVTTESFRTAVLNPSESFEKDETIYIRVPDGFFVSSEGNRIQVAGIKNSGTNIKLLKAEDMVTTTESLLNGNSEQTAVNLTSADGVTASAFFENEFPNRYGDIIRNVTDAEVIIPTDADWSDCVFTGKILTSAETFDIPSEAISVLKAETVNGYIATASIRSVQTREVNGVQLDGILYEEGKNYDMELTVTDSTGNILANISVPLEI